MSSFRNSLQFLDTENIFQHGKTLTVRYSHDVLAGQQQDWGLPSKSIDFKYPVSILGINGSFEGSGGAGLELPVAAWTKLKFQDSGGNNLSFNALSPAPAAKTDGVQLLGTGDHLMLPLIPSFNLFPLTLGVNFTPYRILLTESFVKYDAVLPADRTPSFVINVLYIDQISKA